MTTEDDQPTMGDALNAIIDMTKEQFNTLAAVRDTTEPDLKAEAAEALSQLVRHGNINADKLTASQIAAKLHRRGFGRN